MPTNHLKSNWAYRFLLATIIVVWAFIYYIYFPTPEPLLPNPTAFEWPAIDMMVYFERSLNPTFLLNDFFTNTSHTLSPRMIFGESIMFMASFLGTNYYTIFYVLKSFLKIFLPVVFFFFTCSITTGCKTTHSEQIKDTLLCAAMLIGITWWTTVTFTVANWRAVPIWAAPQSVGLFFALLGGTLILATGKLQYIAGIILLFIGTLVHPTMGLFTTAFMLISAASYRQFLYILLAGILGFGLSAFILDHFFALPFHLPTTEFIQYYIIEPYIHRPHYYPDTFGAYSHLTWKQVASMIAGLLITGAAIAWYLKMRRLVLLSMLYVCSYIGAILMQIIFIKYLPSHTVAVIGPIRFTQFGYMMLAVVFTTLTADLLSKYCNCSTKPNNFFLRNSVLQAGICISIGFALVATTLKWIDDPKTALYDQHPALYQWIQANTKPTDVFAIPLNQSELFIAIPIIANRPVYYANAMAFAEQYMRENMLRKNFLYGSYAEAKDIGPASFYCHQLTANRLQKAAKTYPLQWLIMPNKCLTEHTLSGLPIVFKDDQLTVLKIEAF